MPAFSQLLSLVLMAAALVGASSHHDGIPHHERMLLQPGAKRTAPYIGKRDSSKNGLPYPAPDAAPTQVPQAWTDKYNQAKAAGLIPNIEPPKASSTGVVTYGPNVKLSEVCNWEVDACQLDSSISMAPDGVIAIGLDDGTTTAVDGLTKMLSEQNATISHFVIGSAIVNFPSAMTMLAQTKPAQHIACHSWSHLQLPLFTDAELVADLGWCQQIIYDYTGAVTPYLRPPQGDVDIRVAAIAKYVFGMQVVMWNQDALDWCIQDDGQPAPLDVCKGVTTDKIKQEYSGYVNDSGKKGVLLLGHEIRNSNLELTKGLIVEAKAKGWKAVDSLPVNKKPFDVAQGGKLVTLNSDYPAGAGAVASGAETGNQTSKGNGSTGKGSTGSGATNSSSSSNTSTSTGTSGSQTNTTGGSSGSTNQASTNNSTTASGASAVAVADAIRAGLVATGAALIFAGFFVLA